MLHEKELNPKGGGLVLYTRCHGTTVGVGLWCFTNPKSICCGATLNMPNE